LQAVVAGSGDDCDLPRMIRESKFFHNLARRGASGETPRRTLVELQAFLDDNRHIWEQSWVRFPQSRLSAFGLQVFDADLQVVRKGMALERFDAHRFCFSQNGEGWLRIPISYALKLALADLIGTQPQLPEAMRAQASRLLPNFLSDNTSPETTSFQVVGADAGRTLGEQTARESARRFLFTSLLISWANRHLGLSDSGQRALIYHAPVPSVHQQELAACISDSFYRELFMSPCLSGWTDGEEKSVYMHLCHQVMTRSQLNAIVKLREAGIVANDLIVLPNLSNVSLANNGMHVSIGSRRLSESLGEHGGFSPGEEKRLGDLAVKIYEHFLVLFVGIFSAAPYRVAFDDFHPERLLSFLPHELDFTHLRLMWREWKEKASLGAFGHSLTPYGPRWLDRTLANLFRLRGDCVPDSRLLTYPVAWLATEHASALDGMPGNIQRLSAQLDELGILDRQMSFYMPLRLREHDRHGYAGFEARYYSLFPTYGGDMAAAVNLQQFLLALSYQLALRGEITHLQIPDDPSSESERRQPFFFSAAGLPAFYVQKDSRNQLLRDILRYCKKSRLSRRHPGYVRISIRDYRRAALAFARKAGAELIEVMGMQPVLDDLAARCEERALEAGERMTADIIGNPGKHALDFQARDFNRMAETYYRDTLRQRNLREALAYLRDDVAAREKAASEDWRQLLRYGVRVQDVTRFLHDVERRVPGDDLSQQETAALLNLLLALLAEDCREDAKAES
jgi:hypothetical protein